MTNTDTQAAWDYHDATKHSPSSVRNSTHRLDWPNRPLPFKIYPGLEPIRLDPPAPQTTLPALSVIGAAAIESASDCIPTLKRLGQILFYSAGVTKKIKYPGGDQFFRAAPCTGALYEVELYVVCGDLPGLDAGVYHFGAGDFSLRRMREGDYRGCLADASGQNPSVAQAPATIVFTGTYWRNAWKYQARTYRHFGWDNGTILANTLAMATAVDLPARVVGGFVDVEVNRLLALDTGREVAFSMVPLGRTSTPPPSAPESLPELKLETVPLSPTEVDYPAMRQMHEASSLAAPDEVASWRLPAPQSGPSGARGHTIVLSDAPEAAVSPDSIETTILRRGSTREFARVALTASEFRTTLEAAAREVPADFAEADGAALNDLYLIVNAVDGIPPGSYVYHRSDHRLELLQAGEFRGVAAHLGLDQRLPGDASVAIFFLANLTSILRRYGNRGYRAVQLEAGITGGRIYLAAYAQRLGATGLTFYDDEVVEFFSPHAVGKSAIFLVALGKSVKRS